MVSLKRVILAACVPGDGIKIGECPLACFRRVDEAEPVHGPHHYPDVPAGDADASIGVGFSDCMGVTLDLSAGTVGVAVDQAKRGGKPVLVASR
jgi:hypothetical protein